MEVQKNPQESPGEILKRAKIAAFKATQSTIDHRIFIITLCGLNFRFYEYSRRPTHDEYPLPEDKGYTYPLGKPSPHPDTGPQPDTRQLQTLHNTIRIRRGLREDRMDDTQEEYAYKFGTNLNYDHPDYEIDRDEGMNLVLHFFEYMKDYYPRDLVNLYPAYAIY